MARLLASEAGPWVARRTLCGGWRSFLAILQTGCIGERGRRRHVDPVRFVRVYPPAVGSTDGWRSERLDPALVKFQFQMSTIAQGFVAHEYFTKHPGRFNSMHVQDVDLGAASAAGTRGRAPQVPVGKGSHD